MRKILFYIMLAAAVLFLAVLYAMGIASFEGSDARGLTVTRACGALAFAALLVRDGGNVIRPRCGMLSAIAFSLPALAVAVNNFQWIPFLSGETHVTGTGREIAALAVECIVIGIFEELAFRGIIFPVFLEKWGGKTAGIFFSCVISSAVFGLFHIFNLLTGAGLGATLEQVGYSFLIGGMCAVVYVKTACLPLVCVLHAVYDFCGFLIPRLGVGDIWTTPEIILTAAVGVAVFVFYTTSALKMTSEDAENITG